MLSPGMQIVYYEFRDMAHIFAFRATEMLGLRF